MGLDTTHDCWHGSYSSFNVWREEIAKALDIPIGLMDGWYEREGIQSILANPPVWMQEILDRRLFNYLPIYWETLKPDVIHVLLTHSDCDGLINTNHLIPLAERLEEIAALLPDEIDKRFNMREKAFKFATGLRLAADLGEVVEFR